MSSQAGVFYFDGREISECEGGAILSRARCRDGEPPTGRSLPGVFLAHSALHLGSRTRDLPQPYIIQTRAITFDGRLDNRDELLLSLSDILSGDRSDRALALAAYGRWGIEGLVRLVGDWSLAIWDATQRALILASDFAGVRPLYYCLQGNRVLWSTALGPLVDWADAGEIDGDYVAGLLLSTGCPNRTPYRGIHSVPPGHAVRITRDEAKIQRFWDPPIGDTIRYRRESEYEDQLLSLFREAVRCRLRTTAPVIAELSGGLDSSSAVSMASHLMRNAEVEAPRLVTLSYEHAGSRDARFCSAMEEFCKVESIHVSTAAYAYLTETHTGGAAPVFWEQLHIQAAALARQAGARTYCT